jgi:phage-related protein
VPEIPTKPRGRERPASARQSSALTARAVDVAARGEMAEIAKPLRGLGSGVFEIALAYRSDAYRVVYAVKLGAPVWVVHAFQKKSRTGIKTPKQDIELIRRR